MQRESSFYRKVIFVNAAIFIFKDRDFLFKGYFNRRKKWKTFALAEANRLMKIVVDR